MDANNELKRQYDTDLKKHQSEKRNLTKRNNELRNTLRALKKSTTTSRKSWELELKRERETHKLEREVLMTQIKDLQNELQSATDANKEVKQQFDAQIKTQKTENRNLAKHNKELRSTVRALKKSTTTSRKSWELELKRERETHKLEREDLMTQIKDLQNELQSAKKSFEEQLLGKERKHQTDLKFYMREKRQLKKELETLKVANNKLKMESESKMSFQEEDKKKLRTQNEELQQELEAMKVANYKLQKQLQSKVNMHEAEKKILITRNQDLQEEMKAFKVSRYELQKQFEVRIKVHEEEKEVLLKMNQGLQKELEGIKTRVPPKNLQLVSSRPEAQGQTSAGTLLPKFSINSFHPIRILGEGGFGKVVLAKDKTSDGCEKHFAIKLIKKSFVISASLIITEKEAMILTSGHPFITQLYSCFQTKEHLFFVMEYASGGNMANELQKVGVFSEKRAQFYAAEVTLALEFLHRHGILHRDLKLDNILIDGDGHCKVADFGLSQLGVFRGNKTDKICGTPCYMAPELLQQLPYGHEADWWALGIVMYAMLAGRLPFDDSDRNRLRQKIMYHDVVYPEWISEEAVLIMRRLLKKDPLLRLGSYGRFKAIREQPFFHGIDWRALLEKRIEPLHKPKIVQETEELVTFEDLLQPDNNLAYVFSEEDLDGFSFVNHGFQQ